MIPVLPKPEPADFDARVRQPGNTWLEEKRIELGFSANDPVPQNFPWNALWTRCIDEAHALYGGLCAYLACYMELSSGEVTIDHFQDKKRHQDKAYEWSNYRLSSFGRNRAKSGVVLDPFLVREGWFHLEFTTGKIFPNPALDEETKRAVAATIKNVKLDDARCRKDRLKYFEDYRSGDITAGYLERMHPFVYQEAMRQGLL